MADEIFLKSQIRKILIQENKKLEFKSDSEVAQELGLNTAFKGKNPAEKASNAFKRAISALSSKVGIESSEGFDSPVHTEDIVSVKIGNLNEKEAKIYGEKILKAALLSNDELNDYKIWVSGDLYIQFSKK